MTVLSKWDTVPVSCQEYVHPWSNSCLYASSTLLLPCLKESFRIYVTAYSVAMLMRGKVPNKKELVQTFTGIIRSCIFLISHGVGYSAMCCLLRKALGPYNFFTASYIPSFLSSILSILIERPSRRVLLSLYVTNVASETLFRMAVARNLIKPVRYGEVFVFSASTACLLYIYKQYGLPRDPVFSFLKFLVGPYEGRGYTKTLSPTEPPMPYVEDAKDGLFQRVMEILGRFCKCLRLVNWFKKQVYLIQISISHPTCPHPHSCSYYLLEGVSKKFLHGYLIQLCIKLLMNLGKIMKRPSYALEIPMWPETFRLAVMFSVFCGLFRGINCWGRQQFSEDVSLCALPAGFAAGLTFFLYRDNTIALYFMWKLFQLSYNLGSEWGYLPVLPHAPIFFHAASTAVLFQTAVMEPQNLRTSYWNFLDAMSGGKIAQMGRQGFDAYGLESSKQLERVVARKKRS